MLQPARGRGRRGCRSGTRGRTRLLPYGGTMTVDSRERGGPGRTMTEPVTTFTKRLRRGRARVDPGRSADVHPRGSFLPRGGSVRRRPDARVPLRGGAGRRQHTSSRGPLVLAARRGPRRRPRASFAACTPDGRIGRRTAALAAPSRRVPPGRFPVRRGLASARHRPELTDAVRDLGDLLVGRVAEVERQAEASGPITFTHGDASALNMRTSPDGEVASLDWEALVEGPGIVDVAWHLVSSVAPQHWDSALEAYLGGPVSRWLSRCRECRSFAFKEGHEDPRAWIVSLEEAARRISTGSLPTRTPGSGYPQVPLLTSWRVLGGCPMRPPTRQGGRPCAA